MPLNDKLADNDLADGVKEAVRVLNKRIDQAQAAGLIIECDIHNARTLDSTGTRPIIQVTIARPL